MIEVSVLDSLPRWGYRFNMERWNSGIEIPGECPVPPRGQGLRIGTRQFNLGQTDYVYRRGPVTVARGVRAVGPLEYNRAAIERSRVLARAAASRRRTEKLQQIARRRAGLPPMMRVTPGMTPEARVMAAHQRAQEARRLRRRAEMRAMRVSAEPTSEAVRLAARQMAAERIRGKTGYKRLYARPVPRMSVPLPRRLVSPNAAAEAAILAAQGSRSQRIRLVQRAATATARAERIKAWLT